MGAPRILPSDSKLADLVERGWSHQQIAEWVSETTGHKVGRSSVSAALARAGLTHPVRYTDELPWTYIAAEHNHHYCAWMLRIGARINHGRKVRDVDRKRYESWAARLRERHAVVHYDPDSEEGFYYVPARQGVDTGLVRVPDHPITPDAPTRAPQRRP